jgi:hypothetical protein
LQRPEAIRTGNQFGRLGRAKVVVQPACSAHVAKESSPGEKGQNSKKDIDVDGFPQNASSRFWQSAVVLDRELRKSV